MWHPRWKAIPKTLPDANLRQVSSLSLNLMILSGCLSNVMERYMASSTGLEIVFNDARLKMANVCAVSHGLDHTSITCSSQTALLHSWKHFGAYNCNNSMEISIIASIYIYMYPFVSTCDHNSMILGQLTHLRRRTQRQNARRMAIIHASHTPLILLFCSSFCRSTQQGYPSVCAQL